MPGIETVRVGQEGLIIAQGWAGHQPADSKQLCLGSLVSFGFYYSLSPFHCNYYYLWNSFVSGIKCYITHKLYIFPDSPPHGG